MKLGIIPKLTLYCLYKQSQSQFAQTLHPNLEKHPLTLKMHPVFSLKKTS